jgi:hypothetical protein
MKNYFVIVFYLLFMVNSSAIGQKICETNFSLGISKTVSLVQEKQWGETPPTYLQLSSTKSWYSNNHRFSLLKEVGTNFQYSNIHNSFGGLGASDEYTGSIISLFADASLQARIRINNLYAFGLGPEAEILILGYNNINHSYYSRINYPEITSGSKRTSGINRDYFNQPSYGIKVSLFQTDINEQTTIGLKFSYLWTKSESSNFYASNYTRISLFIGFKKQKKEELLPEPTN